MRVLSKGVRNPGAQMERAGVSEEDLVQAKGRFLSLDFLHLWVQDLDLWIAALLSCEATADGIIQERFRNAQGSFLLGGMVHV